MEKSEQQQKHIHQPLTTCSDLNKNKKNSFCGFRILPFEITTKILKDTKDYQGIAAQCCKQWRSVVCSPKPAPLFGRSIVCSLSVVQWAHDNGCPWTERLCSFASRQGVLAVLQYLHQNGCRWNQYTGAYAAQNNHLNILEWLHHNNYPWDQQAPFEGSWDEIVCEYAA